MEGFAAPRVVELARLGEDFQREEDVVVPVARECEPKEALGQWCAIAEAAEQMAADKDFGRALRCVSSSR